MYFARPVALISLALISQATAFSQGTTCYSGICFPQGDVSFADAVLDYDPAYSGLCIPTNPNFLQGSSALGPPDWTGPPAQVGSVSLGSGGKLEVAFVDNVLTNSGNNNVEDLHIFEVGALVEAMSVAVRPENTATRDLLINAGLVDANGDGFFEVGPIGGAVSSLDLDIWATGFSAGQLRFDAVQLIDDPANNPGCIATSGADVDAIGAITTSPLTAIGQPHCNPAAPNSSGQPGRIEAFGSAVAADNDVFLLSTQLPANSFGYFICSVQFGNPVMPPASQGFICLGGSIGRYSALQQIRRTGPSGTFGLELDLTQTPQPTGLVPVVGGQTWYYQTWFRDAVGGVTTSNFTDATRIQYL